MDKIYPQKMKFLSARFRSFSPNGQNPSPFVFYKLDDRDIPIAESELKFIMDRSALEGLKNSLEVAQADYKAAKAKLEQAIIDAQNADQEEKEQNLKVIIEKHKPGCKRDLLQALSLEMGFDVEPFLDSDIKQLEGSSQNLERFYKLTNQSQISPFNKCRGSLSYFKELLEQEIENAAKKKAELEVKDKTDDTTSTIISKSNLNYQSLAFFAIIQSLIPNYYKSRQKLKVFFAEQIKNTTDKSILLTEEQELSEQIQFAEQKVKNLQQQVKNLVSARKERYQQISQKWQVEIDNLEATLANRAAEIKSQIKKDPSQFFHTTIVNYMNSEKPNLRQMFEIAEIFRMSGTEKKDFIPSLEWLDSQIEKQMNSIANQRAQREIQNKKKDLESKCQQEIEDEKTASQPKIEALKKQIKAATAKKEALELQKYEPDDPNSQIEQMINAPLLPPDFAEIEQNYRQQIAEQISANSG